MDQTPEQHSPLNLDRLLRRAHDDLLDAAGLDHDAQAETEMVARILGGLTPADRRSLIAELSQEQSAATGPGVAIAHLLSEEFPAALAPSIAHAIEDIQGAVFLPSEDAIAAEFRAKERLAILLSVIEAQEAAAVAKSKESSKAKCEEWKDYGWIHTPYRDQSRALKAALAALQGAPAGEGE